MNFYRIFAIVRKDLIWFFKNKQMIALLSSGVLLLLGTIGFRVFFKDEGGDFGSIFSKNSATIYLIMSFLMGLTLSSLVTAQENIDGTFRVLLTTPLKALEFFIGKAFLAFSFSFLFCLILAGVDLFISNEAPHLRPLILFNLFLINVFSCIVGCILGCFSKTFMDYRRVSGYVMFPFMILIFIPTLSSIPQYASIKPYLYFNPFSHFINIIDKTPDTAIVLFHSLYNLLLTGALIVFAVLVARFIFSQKDKSVSPQLFIKGLSGVALLCVMSGLFSPWIINTLNRENPALLELRAEIEKNKQQKRQAKWENRPLTEELIPLKDFFKNSELFQVRISPNGKYLAYLKAYKGRMNIHVRPIDSLEETRITHQKDRDINSFFWKEDETLVFFKDKGGDENYHVFCAFRDGTGEKDLTPFKGVRVQLVDDLDNIADKEILISMNKRDKTVFDLYRLNISTGEIQIVEQNTGTVISWITDHEGKVRVTVNRDGLKLSTYYRETEQEDFKKIMTVDFKTEFSPLFFTFDNKNLYIRHNLGKDKAMISVFDPREKKFISDLYSHPEVDLASLHYSKKRKVLTRISYTTWKTKYHFLDPVFEDFFKEIKTLFPNLEVSVISLNREENIFVLYSYSDRDHGTYWLYDIKQKDLSKIASPRPWLKSTQMAETKALSYKSRDGLTIPAYLTLPQGVKKDRPLPVVVFPHGGPWRRDVWGYNSDVQFLASRGYAVFQMNFRGSTGYGKKFWQAGFKQWGRAMQDDITDGVEYLIKQGIADPKRIAIYGISYGGYTVLAGLAFTPDLYACGVDYVGVSNLFTFFNSIPPYWKSLLEGMYERIGHPEKDKEFLKAVSPVFHVDKIKAPLFVAQGANDPRVKKSESDQIVKALEDRGVLVPYLVKSDEGHGFMNEENRLDFYALMEIFLKNCLQ